MDEHTVRVARSSQVRYCADTPPPQLLRTRMLSVASNRAFDLLFPMVAMLLTAASSHASYMSDRTPLPIDSSWWHSAQARHKKTPTEGLPWVGAKRHARAGGDIR